MSDPTAEEAPVSASKLLPDSEIRHISGRLVYAMDWIKTVQANPLTVTAEQRNLGNMAVYRSAGDVPLLLGEVGILRGYLNETVTYLQDVVKDDTAHPEAKITALTVLGLMQIEVAGKDGDSGN